MLREIRCDKFRSGIVRFDYGLNVILGDGNATNSIGKSTLLMVIDFVLGGKTLITNNKDIVKELGHHDYLFAFTFEEESLYFRRGTFQPDDVYICDETYEIQRAVNVDEYTATLKQAYGLNLPDISFRSLVGLYLRVWGKENLLVDRPLQAFPAQAGIESVDTLIKTFNRYGEIRELGGAVQKLEADMSGLRTAQRHSYAPKITKTQYAKTRAQIAHLERDLDDIRLNLANYASNLGAIINKEVLNLKLRKDELLRMQLSTAGNLQRIERNLENSRGLSSKSFEDLTRFFPEVNQDRLEKVEAFHSGVAKILREELRESKEELAARLADINEAIASIDAEMATALGSVEKPEALVDHVYTVAVSLQSARMSTETYERMVSLRESIRAARESLEAAKERILLSIEKIVNDGMRKIVANVFGEDRKSPTLTLRNDGYSFEVDEDTGTGTAYFGLVLFDLTVFYSTQLPVIAHDSILFKNIENDSVARLLDVYMQTSKQSFIALDEIQKYGARAEKLLLARSVIQLSDDEVLYTKDWRSRH